MDNGHSLTLLRFWAPWCVPCKLIEPTVEKVLGDFDNIKMVSINVDEEPDVVAEYRIRAVPAFVLLEDNMIVEKLTGSVSAQQLKDFLSIK